MFLRPSRIVFLAWAVTLLASPAHADPLYNATALTTPGNLEPIVEGLSNNGQILFWNPWAPAGSPTYSLYNAQAGGTITSLDSYGGSSQPGSYDPQHLGGNGQIIGWLGSQAVLSSNGQNTVIPGWGQAVSDNGQVAYQIGQSSFINYSC